MTDPLPVTGAWLPGDPPGRRQFFTFAREYPFAVESGAVLRDVTIAYETWGTLNEDASNAVLICHAWTGDSHAAGRAETGHLAPGWWDEVIGPGNYIDTDRWFVVCTNVLGGCQGTTGPASPSPDDGRPRFAIPGAHDPRHGACTSPADATSRCPIVGGGDRWVDGRHAGARVGDHVPASRPVARAHRHLHAGQRHSRSRGVPSGGGRSRLDPRWRGGDYYDAEPGDGPTEGLSIARQVAQVTFRSDNAFTQRFGRELTDQALVGDTFGLWQEFEVERYLHYHGDKLGQRFDANSYLIIGKAMDLHDVARGRGGLDRAMARIIVPNLTIGINSDFLYPQYQQQEMAELLGASGVPNRYVEIDSVHGHDAFLIHDDEVGEPIGKFLNELDS